MANIRTFTLASAVVAALFASSASALVLPLSIGADAGVANVKYKGRSATGFFWTVTGNLKLTSMTSIYSGYGETTADIPDESGIDQDFTSVSVPLALQVRVPIVLGDVYVRGGANYYENTYGTEVEDGYGLIGAVGLSLAPAIGPGMAIEVGYQDRGNAETGTVSIGARLNF